MPQVVESSPRIVQYSPDVYQRKVTVIQELENMDILNKYCKENDVSLELLYGIHRGMYNLKCNEPIKFRKAGTKGHLNDENFTLEEIRSGNDIEGATIQAVSFPIFLATEKISDRFIPNGLSIGMISSDGYIVAIQRSNKNQYLKGGLGTAASYLILPYQDFDTRKMDPDIVGTMSGIYNYNLKTIVKNEYGISMDHITVEEIGAMKVRFPSIQTEYFMKVRVDLTGKEIVEIAKANKGNPVGLAENRVFLARPEQILQLEKHKGISMADAHITALHLSGGLDLSPIKDIPISDPTKPCELDIEELLNTVYK